jgi:hypothetical protein
MKALGRLTVAFFFVIVALQAIPRIQAQPVLPWFDRPPGPEAMAVCPSADQWILAYWSNAPTLAESSLFSCPSVNRLWTYVDGRWLGYSRGLADVSDAFLVQMGQAAFLHGLAPTPQPTIVAPTTTPLLQIDLITITSPVSHGGHASATLATQPATTCTAEFVPSSLQPQRLPDLQPQVADATGYVTWQWVVPPLTPRGMASLLVRCGTGIRAAALEIQ